MAKLSKLFLITLVLITGSISLISQEKAAKIKIQIEQKMEPKLKKYATDCSVDIIQDIVPSNSKGSGTRLKDQRNNPGFIRKDSKTYNDDKFLKARGQVKKLTRSPMRANEGKSNLSDFAKREPSLGLLGDREFDNLLDQVRPEFNGQKRLERYREKSKVLSTKRVHGTTLEGNLIAIKRREHNKVKKDGTFLKPRSVSSGIPQLGRMLELDVKLPRQLPRTTASFNRTNQVKAAYSTVPKETSSINHCKLGCHSCNTPSEHSK